MDNTPRVQYGIISVNGIVSAIQEEHDGSMMDDDSHYSVILVMGPTGAGKSSFIEALGFHGPKKISSSRLEGYTKTVSTYKLQNATQRGGSIYLVDSPGFADTKISELAIVSMVQDWIRLHWVFDRILYFMPINHVRLPGSRRRILKTFQALTGTYNAQSVTIVTTMWDEICGESATNRAETTFDQLQNEIWKPYIKLGAKLVRFYNTQESALSIIDNSLRYGSHQLFPIEDIDNNQSVGESPYSDNLRNDLEDRIMNLRLMSANSQADIKAAQDHDELLSVLQTRLKEITGDLLRFEKELEGFGAVSSSMDPPTDTPIPTGPLPTTVTDRTTAESPSQQVHQRPGILARGCHSMKEKMHNLFNP